MKNIVRVALSLGVCSIMVAGPAKADVVYDFTTTSATGFLAGDPALFTSQLVVTNAAFRRGYLNAIRSCSYELPYDCTVNTFPGSGFVSLTDVSPSIGAGSLVARVSQSEG